MSATIIFDHIADHLHLHPTWPPHHPHHNGGGGGVHLRSSGLVACGKLAALPVTDPSHPTLPIGPLQFLPVHSKPPLSYLKYFGNIKDCCHMILQVEPLPLQPFPKWHKACHWSITPAQPAISHTNPLPPLFLSLNVLHANKTLSSGIAHFLSPAFLLKLKILEIRWKLKKVDGIG